MTEALDRLRALVGRATEGPWLPGYTPRYIGGDQFADGGSRKENPVTLYSPAHSEEIATTWTYHLPAEANAALIVQSVKLARLVADQDTVERLAEEMFADEHFRNTDVRATEGHWRICNQDRWRDKAQSILEWLAQKAGE